MNNSLTIKEQTHGSWKIVTIFSGILCVIFFLIYWYGSDPFWTGIVRLASFIFFAATVLGYLKIMDGPLQITLSSTDELLLVSYQKKEKIIQEEQFERDTIKKIVSADPASVLSYLQPDAKTFQINFTDTSNSLYLFEFSGRPLLFSSLSQKEIKDFLKRLEIND